MTSFLIQLKTPIINFLVIVCIGLSVPACIDQKISMDNKLSQAISEQLGIEGRDLEKSDLELLTELEIKGTEILSLAGIENCINLEKLILQNCKLSDISELKHLAALKYLNIALNPEINDITPIGYLTNLEVLIASGIIVEDISPLKNNTKLRRLYLNNAKNIKDIQPLSYLIELNVLEFYDNQISDLAPLSKLVNLERLWCNRNKISDISPLHDLSKLKYLLLSNNSITNLEPLSGLNQLAILDFSFNEVSDIAVIKELIGQGAFTDTSYEIWWIKDIGNSPFINMESNSINLSSNKENREVVELIGEKKIALMHNKQQDK